MLFTFGVRPCQPRYILRKEHAILRLHACLQSDSARPPPPKSVAFARKSTTTDKSRGKLCPEISSAKRISPVFGTLRKSGQSPGIKHVISARGANPTSVQGSVRETFRPAKKGQKVDAETYHGFNEEFEHRRRVAGKKKQLLWPGIWTLFALTGTYGTLAYLDVKAGVPSSDGSHLPARAQLPQTWYLTPAVIREGLVAGWKELDTLTIGVLVVSVQLYLLRRHIPSFWTKLGHVTGAADWTGLVSPLVHSSWLHLASNMTALVWFLPSVVHYFDGDLFHTSAFLISVPLITSYLTLFPYHFNLTRAASVNVGSNGLISAAFGIFCLKYGEEKMWVPAGLVLRLDAREWGLLFVLHQAYNMTKASRSSSRLASMIHLVSFALGLAYAHFNMKHHLWIPLVSEISSTQESSTTGT